MGAVRWRGAEVHACDVSLALSIKWAQSRASLAANVGGKNSKPLPSLLAASRGETRRRTSRLPRTLGASVPFSLSLLSESGICTASDIQLRWIGSQCTVLRIESACDRPRHEVMKSERSNDTYILRQAKDDTILHGFAATHYSARTDAYRRWRSDSMALKDYVLCCACPGFLIASFDDYTCKHLNER